MIQNIKKEGSFSSFFPYFIGIGLSIGFLSLFMQLWEANLNIPFNYTGDATFYLTLIKNNIDSFWWISNSHLAVPFSFDIFDKAPTSDNLEFIIMKIISIFFPNAVVTMNLFFLLTFPLTTVVSIYVLKQFNFGDNLSILGGLLFTFIPYHFLRGEPHLVLSSYFVIPLIIMVCLWIYADPSLFCKLNPPIKEYKLDFFNNKTILSVIICLLLSSVFVYYAVYSCIFLFMAGVCSSIKLRNHYPAVLSIFFILVLFVGFLINYSPALIYEYEHSPNIKALELRPPSHTETYGLKIVQLILPIQNNRIPVLAYISKKYHSSDPLDYSTAALGIIGSIGFIILIFWIFYGMSNDRSIVQIYDFSLLTGLSIFNISAILFATIGGFSSIVSYYFFSGIRANDRISIFIAFFSLMAILIMLRAFSNKFINTKNLKILFNILLIGILIFGLFDQTSPSISVPDYSDNAKKFLNDDHFIKKIENTMPVNAEIFQLPYMDLMTNSGINYPKGMSDYDPLKPYIHSNTLRWSFGTLKDRNSALWQEKVSQKPIKEMVQILSVVGFNGIYIDTYAYNNNSEKEVITKLSDLLQVNPLISEDGRYYFFDMATYNKQLQTQYTVEEWNEQKSQYLSNVPI